jgi:hypothetical protein
MDRRRRRLVAIAVAIAGCTPTSGTPPPAMSGVAAQPASRPIRVRGVDRKGVTLIGARGLPDGGLVLIGESAHGVDIGAARECTPGGVFVSRLDAAGVPAWTRCLPSPGWNTVVAAVGDDAVWIVWKVNPSDPKHVHGDARTLAVADRLTLDGKQLDTRDVIVWRDPKASAGTAEASARNAGENLTLKAATTAGGELLIAGASKTASLTNGRWEVQESHISLHGFVLAVPATGPVRAVVHEPDMLFHDVATANGAYVATGWCSSQRYSPAGTPHLVTCPGSTTAVVVDGDLAGTAKPRVRVIEDDIYDVRGAIADDGTIVVGGHGWQPPIVEGVKLTTSCAPAAFVASWTKAGDLRFARPLGDCKQDRPSPFAHEGVASSLADDRISDHGLAVPAIAVLGGEATVVVSVRRETNGLDWPVRFDGRAIHAPHATGAIVLALDARGQIVRHHGLEFSAKPEGAKQPDGSGVEAAGVGEVVVTAAGSGAWLVVAHAGSLVYDGRRFPLASRITRGPGCDGRYFMPPPRDECEAEVVLEHAIEILPLR